MAAQRGDLEGRDEAAQAIARAEREAAEAVEAEEEARVERAQAEGARAEAKQAVEAVPEDDPLLDTAIRKIEAEVSEQYPYGRPGQPISRRSPFLLAFSASLGVGAAVLVGLALANVRSVLLLLLTAAFLAIGLNPVVEVLERRGLRRGRAVALVFLAVITFFVGFGFAVVPPIVEQATAFSEKVPEYIQQLRTNSTVARLNERFGVLDQAQGLVSNETAGPSAIGGVLGASRVVFSAFFSTLTVLVLTLYFLSNFHGIKKNAYRLVPRSRRARVGILADEILGRVGGFVGGALTIATICGVSTLIFLLVVGVPYALALALFVAILDLVPLVGATIGAVLVTIVAFFVSVPVGIATAVFYLLYQQFENYVIYPRVMKRSVDVSPAATIVAVLIGGALLGVLGALLAIPVTAAVQLIAHEVVVPRQDQA